MKIAMSVYNGVSIGTAWCDIPKEHEELPLGDLVERYVTPSFAAALERARETAISQGDHSSDCVDCTCTEQV